MGFILYLVSSFLRLIIVPTGLVYGFVKDFRKHHIGIALQNINKRYVSSAKARDEYGNMVCPDLFNATLITKESTHFFGTDGEKISEVVAFNYYAKTLTGFGRFVAFILIKLKDTAFNHS